MDGENNGKPYKNGMIWGVKTPIFGNTHMLFQGFPYFQMSDSLGDWAI